MNNLYYFIKVLLTPTCWLRNSPTSRHWDASVLENLKSPEWSDLQKHTVKLNGKTIWISNYPYASCTDHRAIREFMPSRITVFKFFDAIEENYQGRIRSD